MAQHGSLSINSENIFPIIKKWMYSDHDIFFRELISNGCDAVTKLKKLSIMGEYEMPDDYKPKITVEVSAKDKTIIFTDNGLGMTAEEVEEYINQIAFSGAEAFLEKYKDKANEDQIIGHFGLGFYSAFMVAERVTIDTLSYKEGAKAVHWECDGGTEYDMADGDKEGIGTKITLFLNDDCTEFANEYKAREVIEKYCSFMPYEIYLNNTDDTEEKTELIEKDDLRDTDEVIETVVEEAQTKEVEDEDGNKKTVETKPASERYKIKKRPVPLNDTEPLWTKHPNECTDEEYKEFYRKVFHDYKEPLFWIHLNMDYPFNLKGILYFPKINIEFESAEGVIKLYNNQVFVADNVKEVIPEFLMLLKGVIDCPDLPLNVSRSALQNDGFAKKISDYITKKVADKLSGMYKTDKENYEKYWDDISPFIKFGCLKDDKFCEKMNDFILFKNIEGKYLTLPECLEENKESHPNTVFYVNNENEQGQYIRMFKDAGMDAVILKHNIDQPFINQLEQKNKDLKFLSIDSDLSDTFKEDSKDVSEEDKKKDEELNNKLSELFKKALENEQLNVKAEKLKNADISSMITINEDSKRTADMMRMYGMNDPSFAAMGETLVLNLNNSLVNYIIDNPDSENVPMFCRQLYDLARISHAPLTPDAMAEFVSRSNQIMGLLAK
ncbi:MAG: molecular chaperone HtpG [Butyrivibrio sp.]